MADIIESLPPKLQPWFFTKAQQQIFLEDLSQLIEDGVPANQAVETIAGIASGSVKLVANNILKKIAEGKLLADGMQGWFAQPIVEIIRAGEEGGTLAENMVAGARSLGHQVKGFSSILGSVLYPLSVIVMGIIVSIFVKHSVFVNFAQIKPANLWPSNGQTLLAVSTFFEDWWWIVILIIIALFALIARLMSELTGPIRQSMDKIPIFSLYRDLTAAQFMEVLGLLITNGIIVKRALTIIRAKANHYLAWHIYQMELRLSGGRDNIAEVIDTGLIKEADILRLRVIAKGKGFEHALIRLGRLSAERTAKNIERVGRIFGFILLGIGAAWAAFMVFAIYGVGSFVAT